MILTGFSHVGKSYFGQRIAARKKIAFIDTDQRMLDLYPGYTIRTLYDKLGAYVFRKLEQQLLLTLPKNSVIALGGGALLSYKCRCYLYRLSMIVYLECNPNILYEKLCANPPTFFHLTPSKFKAMYARRTLWYKRLSTYTIRVDELSEEEILHTLEQL